MQNGSSLQTHLTKISFNCGVMRPKPLTTDLSLNRNDNLPAWLMYSDQLECGAHAAQQSSGDAQQKMRCIVTAKDNANKKNKQRKRDCKNLQFFRWMGSNGNGRRHLAKK